MVAKYERRRFWSKGASLGETSGRCTKAAARQEACANGRVGAGSELEAVSHAAHREQVLRLGGVGFELRAELGEEVVDGALSPVVPGPPDARLDLVAGADVPAGLDA